MSYEQYNFLAQVFTVQDSTGIYLTSVDLFFSNKDEILPVTVQLRSVMHGVPSNVIIPFSEVTLKTDEVNTSYDSSSPTKFTFSSPVYLSGPIQQDIRGNSSIDRITKEYCLVVLSNSQKYEVYTARIGVFENNEDFSLTMSPTPFAKSLFKPKTAGTWESSKDEILKFSLNRAYFQNEGIVRFFNPKLTGLMHETVTSSNNFLTLSKKILVGLSSSNYDVNEIVPGVTIKQNNASGKLSSISGSISSGVDIGIVISNPGFGYTTGTYTNINLISETGLGKGATATLNVSTTEISTVNVINGGFGYSVGDILTIGDIPGNAGFGVKLIVDSIEEGNSFILDNVQGTFTSGISTVSYEDSSGSLVSIGIGSDIYINNIFEDPLYDGLHMKIYHQNHDMNSYENYVKISEFYPLTTEVNSKLTAEVGQNDTTPLQLESTVGFETFEGLPVSETNPGYVIIGKEIIEYTGITGNSLTGITRAIDAPILGDGIVSITLYITYPIKSYVYKYELKGISLRRINKVHKLSEINDQINYPIEIDSYYIKIETSDLDFDGKSIGKNRLNSLYFSETSLTGDFGVHLSQNVQYSSLYPTVKTIIPTLTNIQGRVRTFSGTSANGNENCFEDNGYTDILLNGPTIFNTPRLIASSVNEERHIKNSPGNRSFSMELILSTQDDRVSPLIDLEEISVKFQKYRLNNPIQLDTYSTNDSIRSLRGDPHACIYISKPVYLNFPSNSLKVLLSAYTGVSGNIRVLYRLFNLENQNLSSNYELFPGYSNYKVDSNGIKRVIDPSLNDGTSDSFTNIGSEPGIYEYEYTADDLQYFNGFSIKVIISGTNQADPPYLNDIRAIANIKPDV
jgi:hypothetical protein